MAAGRLFRVVGSSIAADHVGRGVAEQVLNVQLAGVLLDRPGGEGATEAVGVDLGEAGLSSQVPEELLQTVGPQGDAGTEGAMAACSSWRVTSSSGWSRRRRPAAPEEGG